MRIALIHALKHSIQPIEASFARLWPDASLMNLLDDSLSADLARDGRLTEAMTGRSCRSDGMRPSPAPTRSCSPARPSAPASTRSRALTRRCRCSAEPGDDRAGRRRGGRIGLLASFAPTLVSMPPEFPASVEVVPKLAEGALAALDRGDRAEHDRLVVEASRDLRDCDLIALAQYSMAPTAVLVAEASGRPVLTTPDSAVQKLKQLLGGDG